MDPVQKTTRVTTRHNTRQHDATQGNTSTTRHNTTQHDTTRHNTRQHEYNTRQHNTTRVNTSPTRDNTGTTRVQNNIKFTLIYFTSSLYTRSLVYQALNLCLHGKLQKTENCFFQQQQKQSQKSQDSGMMQLCFCLSIY